MSHILTFKIPHHLLHRLEDLSERQGVSKGALIREAIELLFEKSSNRGSSMDRVKKITQALFKKKKMRVPDDWNDLRKKAVSSSALLPEEEVLKSRRRGL